MKGIFEIVLAIINIVFEFSGGYKAGQVITDDAG